MKKQGNTNFFRIGCTLIGTIVGAGFASGKEIIRFFGDNPNLKTLVFILLFALFSLTSFLFLFIGKIANNDDFSNVTAIVFKKSSGVFKVFILFCNFIIYFAMMAGCDALMKQCFSIEYKFFGLFTAIISIIIIDKGVRQIENINTILVPVMIVFIVAIYSISYFNPEANNFYDIKIQYNAKSVLSTISNIILYVAMNMLTSIPLLTKIGFRADKKSVAIGSVFGSFFISFTILIMLFGIFNSNISILQVDIPLLMLSGRVNNVAKFFAFFVIWIGILTTLISSLHPLKEFTDGFTKNKQITYVFLLIAGFLLSGLGFSQIINVLFPLIGCVGVVVTIYMLIFYIKNKKAHKFKLNI